MTQISSTAEAAREQARAPDGKFGVQPATESGQVTLDEYTVTPVTKARFDLYEEYDPQDVDDALSHLHPRHGGVYDDDQLDRARQLLDGAEGVHLYDCRSCGNAIGDDGSGDVRHECAYCNEWRAEDRDDFELDEDDSGLELGQYARRAAAGTYGDEIATRVALERFENLTEVHAVDRGETDRLLTVGDEVGYYQACRQVYEAEVFQPVDDEPRAQAIAALSYGIVSVRTERPGEYAVTTASGQGYTVLERGAGAVTAYARAGGSDDASWAATRTVVGGDREGAVRTVLTSAETQAREAHAVREVLTELGEEPYATDGSAIARGHHVDARTLADGTTEVTFTDEGDESVCHVVDVSAAGTRWSPHDGAEVPAEQQKWMQTVAERAGRRLQNPYNPPSEFTPRPVEEA